MPISSIDGCSEAHWEQVRTIIEESLEGTDLAIELVSDADEVGVIQKRIIQNIYDNDIVICDVSCKNPNVMFELGMRLAFDKPAVIIKDEITPYTFDTSPVEHLNYPRGLHYHQIQEFKTKLRAKVTATLEASKKPEYTTFLKHFGKFVVAKIEEKHLGKDEFILESLQELRKEFNRFRIEQQELGGMHRIGTPSANRRENLSAEAFMMNFLSFRKFADGELVTIKDRKSPLYKDLLEAYQRSVLSRVASPMPIHEQIAEQELLKVINRFVWQ